MNTQEINNHLSKTDFQLSILHIFEPFQNEDLGKHARMAHRQNYRNLAIRYPHIALNIIYVYPLDDRIVTITCNLSTRYILRR